MLLWLGLFIGLFLLWAGGIVYLVGRVHRFQWITSLSQGKRTLSWVLSAGLVVLLMVLLYLLWGMMNAILCLLHLVVFWLFSEGVCALIQKVRHQPFRRYYAGAAALICTFAYLSMGWVQAHQVWEKSYVLQTDKEVGNLRVALLADSHVGTTFDGDGFAQHLERIQAQHPDVVVLAGDFVDEGSSREDMLTSCAALGSLQTPYGVYFVFGNHDKGNYSRGERGYDGQDLKAALEENGVQVLQDETVLLGEHFYLIGRQDASEELEFGGGRASMAELTEGLESQLFSIVLDHQPHDYAAQAQAGVDLVLSGHTHGGQVIPLMQLMEWTGIGGTDSVYGFSTRGNTSFIVTSGISDWAIQFKTGCRSEYVLIDIQGNPVSL